MPPLISSPARSLTRTNFHHLGVACSRIADEKGMWSMLGYEPEGSAFIDEAQGIRGQFMIGGGPRIELLEDLDTGSTLAPWLKRGVKIYHTGYKIAPFDNGIDEFLAAGAILVREPMQSVYFRTRIAFLMTRAMMLIELIEDQGASA